ncbi:hypothetical protein [Lacrimispora sp. 210928-DFI.3.58]|uniref:hypothetical protein n=1 Tax=Lacrimispora sp. 210928-DFI.3.58 TaxID=2883214 RepID=UPI001D066282|nr:hypothetical protein [Lacrimispora sp. 210928-DFI.3.58]MCB7321107.1 hypothetical protein [Lacrimispora sp. 210928-DFI.3.58]
MDSVFLLDGKSYNVEVEADSLERSFAVTDTDQSGRTLDYTMNRDIIGTFYNYAMKVYPKPDDLAAYDAFYDAISDPNYDSHEMTFPYGQETLTFQAYVSQGKDRLRIRKGRNIWGMEGMSLNFTAMEPQRRR